MAFAKIIAHWLTFGPLLLIAAIPGSALLAMSGESLVRTEIALAVGSVGLASLGVAVAAVTSGFARSGSLASLLLLPLAIPLLIFGAAASAGGHPSALPLEAAVSVLLIAGAPFIAGAAIRAART